MWSESRGFGSAANVTLPSGRTLFPAGTRARIFRRGRSAMSSGTADTRCWRMVFCGPGGRFIEPIVGWTGTTDPLGGLELKFPTLEAAIHYARRQGLDFAVAGMPARSAMPAWLLHQMNAPAVVEKQAA